MHITNNLLKNFIFLYTSPPICSKISISYTYPINKFFILNPFSYLCGQYFFINPITNKI